MNSLTQRKPDTSFTPLAAGLFGYKSSKAIIVQGLTIPMVKQDSAVIDRPKQLRTP
jgi:hypothetical protein